MPSLMHKSASLPPHASPSARPHISEDDPVHNEDNGEGCGDPDPHVFEQQHGNLEITSCIVIRQLDTRIMRLAHLLDVVHHDDSGHYRDKSSSDIQFQLHVNLDN